MITALTPSRLLFSFLLPWAFSFSFSPSLLNLPSTSSASHSPPFLAHAFPIDEGVLFRLSQVKAQNSERGIFFSWWGLDSSVSIVDRSPPIAFTARPASFGLSLEEPLLGYVIPLDAFTVPCEKDNSTSESDELSVESVDEVFDDSSGSGKPTEEGRVSDRPTDTPDNLGCPKVCVAGPYEPDSNEPWVALVQRGGCQFVDKAREAQRLGARAIVVGGDNPDIYGNPDTLVNMYSPGAYMPTHSIIRSPVELVCRRRIGCESCRNVHSLFGLHRAILSHRSIEHLSQRSQDVIPAIEH